MSTENCQLDCLASGLASSLPYKLYVRMHVIVCCCLLGQMSPVKVTSIIACMLLCLCLMQNDIATTLMDTLDKDQDGKMDFSEYCSMITGLAMYLHMVTKQAPK